MSSSPNLRAFPHRSSPSSGWRQVHYADKDGAGIGPKTSSHHLAADISPVSFQARETSWVENGRPSAFRPLGRLIAGRPSMVITAWNEVSPVVLGSGATLEAVGSSSASRSP